MGFVGLERRLPAFDPAAVHPKGVEHGQLKQADDEQQGHGLGQGAVDADFADHEQTGHHHEVAQEKRTAIADTIQAVHEVKGIKQTGNEHQCEDELNEG